MAVTLKELCTATLQASAAAIYTPSSASGQVDDARFTNNSGSSVNVSLWRVTSGGAPNSNNIILLDEAVAAGETVKVSLAGLVIPDGSSLYGLASTAGVVVAALSGREQAT